MLHLQTWHHSAEAGSGKAYLSTIPCEQTEDPWRAVVPGSQNMSSPSTPPSEDGD